MYILKVTSFFMWQTFILFCNTDGLGQGVGSPEVTMGTLHFRKHQHSYVWPMTEYRIDVQIPI